MKGFEGEVDLENCVLNKKFLGLIFMYWCWEIKYEECYFSVSIDKNLVLDVIFFIICFFCNVFGFIFYLFKFRCSFRDGRGCWIEWSFEIIEI